MLYAACCLLVCYPGMLVCWCSGVLGGDMLCASLCGVVWTELCVYAIFWGVGRVLVDRFWWCGVTRAGIGVLMVLSSSLFAWSLVSALCSAYKGW